jgi:hypothetical protein
MSDTITINPETFDKLTDLRDKPVRFIFRQVGDGPVVEYHLTRNGDINVTSDVNIEPGGLASESMQRARTSATVTGSVGGTWIEQNADPVDFAVAAQWVREGSYLDQPVIVEQDQDPELTQAKSRLPEGTKITYWPGFRTDEGRKSVTRSEVWRLPSGSLVVKVDGYAGGIALTHITQRFE